MQDGDSNFSKRTFFRNGILSESTAFFPTTSSLLSSHTIMRLTLQNLTQSNILCRHGDTANALDGHLTVLSSSTTTTDLPEHYSNLTLSITSHPDTKQEQWTIHPNSLAIQFTMALSASWRAIAAPPDCPWRIYCNRVSATEEAITHTDRTYRFPGIITLY